MSTSIRSYIVHTLPGRRDAVAELLRALACDVYPAENGDVVVMVAEHEDVPAQQAFDARLATLPGVASVAFVSGHTE
jgi:nitrate reductase NapAB chaperone NapD